MKEKIELSEKSLFLIYAFLFLMIAVILIGLVAN